MEESTPGLAMAVPDLEFTAERIIPGKTPEALFREHEERYIFAGQYVAGKDVLDVACGMGIGTSYLRRAGATACYGFDVNVPSIQYAKSVYPECKFAVCDAGGLSLPEESVDVVVSFETIEHLADPAAFLSECRRVLRPNGLLICSTPDYGLFRWVPPNPYHVSEMRPDELLSRVMEKFICCDLYGQTSVNYPAYVAQAILRKRVVPVLDRFGLKGLLQRHRTVHPPAICTDRHFTGCKAPNAKYQVVPYHRQWHRKQAYVIVAARKPDVRQIP